MPTLFTRIVRGEIPCHKVWEDDRHLAFLDIAPVQPGHTLVIPKREVSYLFDLPAGEQAELWKAVAHVEHALKAATRCPRVCLLVVGWEVPHVHVHLVPTHKAAELPFPPKMAQTQEQLAATAAQVKAALARPAV
jgi:histidine triad (HIT) family protein